MSTKSEYLSVTKSLSFLAVGSSPHPVTSLLRFCLLLSNFRKQVFDVSNSVPSIPAPSVVTLAARWSFQQVLPSVDQHRNERGNIELGGLYRRTCLFSGTAYQRFETAATGLESSTTTPRVPRRLVRSGIPIWRTVYKASV